MLPIESHLDQIRDHLARTNQLIIEAPPGAGKTTLVPPALLQADWLQGGKILMLQPRRLAARATAARMADLLNTRLGERVGYQVRFERRISVATRIEVVTEGILTRRLLQDPELSGVNVLIFDEFHERHLQSDLGLALALECQRVWRPDLKLIVMSATLEGMALQGLLPGARQVVAQGRSFPVETHYLPAAAGAPPLEHWCQAIRRAVRETQGDVLVFLPGTGEIRRCQARLEETLGRELDLVPLYGELNRAQQDRALAARPGRRRVILATNVAETSLTIEGISVVVDTGLAKRPRFDPRSGLTQLQTLRVSRASATQRAGRAGRLGPGVCYRLWSEGEQQGLLAQHVPEIQEADLAGLVLQLAEWGESDPQALDWLDPLPAGAVSQARALLTDLQALDDQGRITPMGQAMAKLPLHPRMAHMLLGAQALGCLRLAAELAALLNERDPMDARLHGSDLMLRLEWFERQGGKGGLTKAAVQYCRILGEPEAERGPLLEEQVAELLMEAYPDRVAKHQGGESYQLMDGTRVELDAADPLIGSGWLVAPLISGARGRALIRLAVVTTEAALRRQLNAHIRTEEACYWDGDAGRVRAERLERLGRLVLSRGEASSVSGEQMLSAMLEGIRALGLNALPWSDASRGLQARVESLRAWCPEESLPDLSDAWLREHLEEWLGPFLSGIQRRDQLAKIPLTQALLSRLDWQQRQRLDQGAPERLPVPSGSRIRVEYDPTGEPPVLAVKLQELFGLADTPKLAWGRMPVVLHLLNPARRPIQVTQDLRNFWNHTYAEVKKELKGRYPKHPWPDDPWNAQATARAKPRRA